MKSPAASSTPFFPRVRFIQQLAAEWRQFLLLAKCFWRRFFESDLLSRQAGLGLGIPDILALVALPGILVPFLLKLKYIGLAGLPVEIVRSCTLEDKLFFVAYSMTLSGLLAVLVWDSLFLDQRDFAVLSPLPVRRRTLYLAKMAAATFFPAVFLLAIIHVSPVLMASFLLPVPSMTEPGTYVVAHAVAVFAAGAFTFLCVAAFLAAIVDLLGYRLFRRFAGYVQFVLTWLILSLTLLCPKVLADFNPSRALDPAVHLFPPMWFLGLFEVLLGRNDPAFRQLSSLAVHALAAVGGTALFGTLAAYLFRIKEIREYRQLPGKRSESGIAAALRRWVNQCALRHPLERAVFHFTLQTLLRSSVQRMILTGYAGLGIAFAADSLSTLFSGGSEGANAGQAPLLSVQLILPFFLLSGMRFVFTLPAEIRANWIFRLTESERSHLYFSGVRKTMLLGVLPCGLLLPSYALLLGWTTALVHLLYGVACSLLLMELLLVNFHKIPFTCTYLPGKARLLTRWPIYWFVFSLYGFQLAVLENWALRSSWRIGPLIVLLLLLASGLRWWNRRNLDALRLAFEEQPESFCVLNLSEP